MERLSKTALDDDTCLVLENNNTQKMKNSGSCLDLESDINSAVKINEDKLEGLFFEFLSLFYKQVYGDSIIKPMPSSKLDNGETVDLLKLFLSVRGRGGYHEVSKSGLWLSIAKECGFDSSVIPKLKLVYFNYLDLLDRWLPRSVKREDCEGEVINKISYLNSLAMELGSGFKALLSEIMENKKNGDCFTEEVKSGLVLKDSQKLCKSEEDCGGSELKGVMSSVDDKSVVEDCSDRGSEGTRIHNDAATNVFASIDFSTESVKDNDMVSESSATEEHKSNKKRKRRNDSGLLKWISEAAREPCDQSLGSIPERSKWKSHNSEHLWKQVLLVREAMFLKPPHFHWKNKPMHPAMFEDSVLGCRQRMAASQRMASIISRRKLQCILNRKMSSSGADTENHFWLDRLPVEGSILVGPEFQAYIPEWNGDSEESDPKWSGSRIWPIGTKGRGIHLVERERIGKGREDTCGCQYPGSLECVKFHVSEKRKRVKLELGSAYYEWKFDEMGEEVASFWTREEEERFHNAVKSIPFSKGMRLFKELCKVFPGKDMSNLVRYYFNVHLLDRRANQNRTSPNDIDSNDEEENVKSANDIDSNDEGNKVIPAVC